MGYEVPLEVIEITHTRMSRWKLGSKVCKWVISPTYKWRILGLKPTYIY